MRTRASLEQELVANAASASAGSSCKLKKSADRSAAAVIRSIRGQITNTNTRARIKSLSHRAL